MADKTKASDPTQVEKNVGEILSKTDQFVDKHLKQILIGVAAVILIVVGIILFRSFYLAPREKSAEAALFPAQNYFADQNWDLALNGDSIGNIGFLDAIHDYSSTKSANLAKYYAGLCQYRLGEYDGAIKNLKSYSGKDRLVAAQALGAIGDCEVNLGNVKAGTGYYHQAAEKANSSLLSPVYLQKAAIAYESLQDYKSALDAYTAIKNKYPQSMQAASIDKYIERAQALLNK
jgi:tetratricopeptide (TPR) repeat protein